MASCAGEDAGGALGHLPEHGEELEDLLEPAVVAAAAGFEAEQEVFEHGELRKDAAPLGHVADAGARAGVRGPRGEVAASGPADASPPAPAA